MKLSHQHRIFSLLATFASILLAGTLATAESRQSVAILPFILNAPPDLQYLQEGLQDILGSRLRAEAGVTIIPKTDADSALNVVGGKPTQENLPILAKKLGVDYVVFGTATAVGGGISIDTQVFTAAAPTSQALQAFYSSTTNKEQIMQGIDDLAWNIIEKLFGKKRPP